MDIKLLEDEINSAQRRIAKNKKYIAKTRQEIAEHLCPFKVGDNILSPEGVKVIVASIHHRSWGDNYEFKIYKIKNDGEPYKDSCNIWSRAEEYTKVEP